MRKKTGFRRNNNRRQVSRPFDAQIKQLNRESLILVTLVNAKEFCHECFNRGIKVGVGDTLNDESVIIYKD